MPEHPPTHTILIAATGDGKSTAAVTWPKPMLVLLTDPPDKAGPYRIKLDEATGRVIETFPVKRIKGPTGRVEEITRPDGIVRIEHYHDPGMLKGGPDIFGQRAVREARAFAKLLSRCEQLYDEFKKWKTIVLDSATYFVLHALKYEQYVLNPGAKDPRQWRIGAADACEELLMTGLPSLHTNLVLTCHVRGKRDAEGNEIGKSLSLPGRIGDPEGGIAIGWGEVYYLHADWSEKRQRYVRRFQTQRDDSWHCSTQIGAKNHCLASYAAVWGEKP
jgi:hypothetical protein